MSVWSGKFVIGLTGNIATGKSVVRKMLEHLGAYGIDADALAHRAIAQGAPGYKPVVDMFGKWVIGPDGQIDRARLGRIVFSDPAALAALEKIIHPLVRQAVDTLVRRSRQPVIVLEAIKLVEGPLRAACDSIWVAYAPKETQLERLIHKRNMTREAALQRIEAQHPQEAKIKAANIVIRNDGTYEATWQQVTAAWQKLFPDAAAAPRIEVKPAPGKPQVERAGPKQAAEIAEFINRQQKSRTPLTSADIMAAFGEKAFLLLRQDTNLIGLVGWQVENLVARTSEVYLESMPSGGEPLRLLLEEVERLSRELLCEALLLFLPANLARQENLWRSLNYEKRSIPELGVRAWQEAALESMPPGTILFFKQLRKDRVLRPV